MIIFRFLTTEARIQSQACPHGIFNGCGGIGTGFSLRIPVFPCQYHFVIVRTHLHLQVLLLPEGQTSADLGPFETQCCCGNSGALDWIEQYFHLVCKSYAADRPAKFTKVWRQLDISMSRNFYAVGSRFIKL